MVLTLGFTASCTGSPSGDSSSSGSQSGGSSSSGGSTSDSSSSGGDTKGYEYGNDHADDYDAAYTRKLLDMGEQYFTVSQLSGVFDYGSVAARGARKEGKYVGIFYFMWHEEQNGLYDISKIQATQSDPYNTNDNVLWANEGSSAYDASVSPQNALHYFEEPLYGYYTSKDKWVIRKHLELLTLAGIDFLYLDFTNANVDGTKGINLYKEQTLALMDVILEMQSEGYEVPRVVPICCNNSTQTENIMKVVEWVYNNYYAADNFKYKNCWFTADKKNNPSGKPLLVSYTFDKNYSNKAVADAFWVRNVVWPTLVTEDSYKNGFPWMDYSLPQKNYDGIMNVSIAQHIGGSWSSEAFLARSKRNSTLQYRGRGALANQTLAYETDDYDAALTGNNFITEWRNVLNYEGDDLFMVTVTGWNEWVAQKLNVNGQYATFVDTYNVAFSRDIEMMRDADGYGDTYFLQLAQFARQFKYEDPGKASGAAMWQKTTVDYADISAWDGVKAKYLDLASDAKERNAYSVGKKYLYTDTSARNDIDYVKIANDEQYLYVLVAAKKDITAHESGDTDWMNLWLTTGAKGGWNGYDFIINRSPENGKTSIEALGKDAKGNIVAVASNFDADYYLSGKYISYRIPLEALGVTSASEIGVKATDNIFANKRTDNNDGVGVYSFGDIFAFYCGGDCAPARRLNYAYRLAY